MLSIPVFSVYCCTARPVNFTLPSSQTSFTVTWKYIRGTADAWLKKKLLAIMKTGYAGNYLYLPKCFEREISAYLYCYSWCMHILHTATQGPKSTNYLKQQEKVNDIYSDFGFVVWVFSPCFLKHGAVWMYQNSWLSFYSAVQPCSVVPPPYRTSS